VLKYLSVIFGIMFF